jgi:septum site-determining protein MinD
MGRSICIASGKGGVGKSTLCANLASALAVNGMQVSIVDTCGENSAMPIFFGGEIAFRDSEAGEAKVQEATVQIWRDHGPTLDIIRTLMDGMSYGTFKGLITDVAERYDMVIVDTPGHMEKGLVTTFSACDEVLIATTPDILSISTALKIKVIATELSLDIMGVVLNKCGSKFDVPTQYIEDMLRLRVISEIPDDDEVRAALSAGVPVIIKSPKSPAGIGITRILDLIFRMHKSATVI